MRCETLDCPSPSDRSGRVLCVQHPCESGLVGVVQTQECCVSLSRYLESSGTICSCLDVRNVRFTDSCLSFYLLLSLLTVSLCANVSLRKVTILNLHQKVPVHMLNAMNQVSRFKPELLYSASCYVYSHKPLSI